MSVSLEFYRESFRNTEYEVDVAANAEKVRRILQLKEEKNVLILGHNYMHPLVFGLSDESGSGRLLGPRPPRRRDDLPCHPHGRRAVHGGDGEDPEP